MSDSLRVSEMFWSPQGEGARAGEMSLFVRLQGCSAKHACYESGVRCDTEFESGRETPLADITAWADKNIPLAAPGSPDPLWIVWTGGEPLDQLTPDVVEHFTMRGWRQALETSGVRPFPREFRERFDWIACSPKVAEHVLTKHMGEPAALRGTHPDQRLHVHELRYVRHVGQDVPQPSLTALTYYLSPHSDGAAINPDNLRHVLGLMRAHPRWRLSVQQHKQWRVL